MGRTFLHVYRAFGSEKNLLEVFSVSEKNLLEVTFWTSKRSWFQAPRNQDRGPKLAISLPIQHHFFVFWDLARWALEPIGVPVFENV